MFIPFLFIMTVIELNEWMEVLDKRYQSKHKDAPVRARTEGAPSKSKPPPGAPKWAVKRTWIEERTGIRNFICLLLELFCL